MYDYVAFHHIHAPTLALSVIPGIAVPALAGGEVWQPSRRWSPVVHQPAGVSLTRHTIFGLSNGFACHPYLGRDTLGKAV